MLMASGRPTTHVMALECFDEGCGGGARLRAGVEHCTGPAMTAGIAVIREAGYPVRGRISNTLVPVKAAAQRIAQVHAGDRP